VAYLTQTTLSLDDTREIVEVLKRRFPKLARPAKDDICYATQNRQDSVKAMAPFVDLLLVLGAPNSSNSLRLCEVARDQGVPSHLIERAGDIRPEWLAGVRVLGLTASAVGPRGSSFRKWSDTRARTSESRRSRSSRRSRRTSASLFRRS
jgi:4-hydroxy-3-methylbut-2-enyl diphosphate reductase